MKTKPFITRAHQRMELTSMANTDQKKENRAKKKSERSKTKAELKSKCGKK